MTDHRRFASLLFLFRRPVASTLLQCSTVEDRSARFAAGGKMRPCLKNCSTGPCSTSGRALPPYAVQHNRYAQLQRCTAGRMAQGSSAALPNHLHTADASSGPQQADVAALKQMFREAVKGIDRGIFGVPAAKRQEVASIVEALEVHNPLLQPTQHLDQVAGSWNLLYTTINITGVKKTKLGLREFIKLGEFQQQIDVDNKLALNVVQFSVAGLGMLSGSLTVKAAYQPVSNDRVEIKFIESTLVPEQLQQLFQQNYDLLLSIFNPEGWLDITYVDQELRVGRDDKGNLFVLERAS